jgi:ATP-binding cassette subfamily B protein
MLKLFKRFLKPYRVLWVVGPLLKVIEVVFDLLTPLVIAWMIDAGVLAGDGSVVWKGGLMLVAMAFLGFGFTLFTQKIAGVVATGFSTHVRAELYRHINELSYADLDRFNASGLLTRMTSDINQLQLAVAMGIRQVIRWPILAIGSVVAALMIDVKLGLVFCVTMPVIALVFWWVMKKSIPYYAGMQEKLDNLGRVVRESLSGVRPIRAYRRQESEREKFDAAAADQADTAIAVGRLSALLSPATFVVMNVGICAILWLGGIAVDAGSLEPGQIMAFIGYMNQLLVSIVFVASLVVIFTRAWASGARVQEVLDTEPSIVDAHEGVMLGLENDAPALAFDRVTFSYGGEEPALENVSFELPAGATLGVIGGIGSGKSSLVNLCNRMYDVTAGSVSVAGHDVRDYSFAQLRQLVSVVPQKASLISGTIRTNLEWRDHDATDEDFARALDIAQASEFVSTLPDGIDSRVEANGRNFSGGQRQRLTIARALVGPARLLLFDDSSSALDYATDAKLRGALSGLVANGTSCVIVSQRVSSISSCDNILVLDAGRVVGYGPHEDLLESCPVYQEICASQFKAEEVENG